MFCCFPRSNNPAHAAERFILSAREALALAVVILALTGVGCNPFSRDKGGGEEVKTLSAEEVAEIKEAKAEAVQNAITGVAFDPDLAAGDTGAVRGVAVAAGVRAADLGGAQGVRGGVREGVRAGVQGGVRATVNRAAKAAPTRRGELARPLRQSGDEQPISGARVRIEGTSFETISDEDGSFYIPFIPAGDYTLVGEKQGDGGEVYAFGQSLSVAAGSDNELGPLSLAETGAIRGRVRRADATSQLGIDVFIPGTNFVAKTDDDGNFNIIYIPQGTYRLAAMFPGFEPFRWKDVAVQSRQTTELEAIELKRAALDKASAASIFGRVTAAGGGGVRDALVTTLPESRQTQSDSAGNFILSNIAPGVYLVKAARPGFSDNSRFVDITESLFDKVEIRLAPGADLLAETNKEVKGGAAPSVSIDGPNSVAPGGTATFRANVSDPDSESVFLKWKAGGGGFDNTWNSEVNWTAPTSKGVFIVEVTVTDGTLTDRASTVISVAPEGQTVTLDTTPPFPPRPDRLKVTMSPPGTNDEIRGEADCVEPNATVKFYADGLLAALLASTTGKADGAFDSVSIGDNPGDQNDQVFIAVFDASGNLSPVYFVVNDKTAPDTVITATPCSAGQTTCLSAKNSGTFEFSTAEAAATFECKIDTGTFASCSSPHTFSSLANGSHLAVIRAKDAAGNVDPFPASFAWSADATAPVVGAPALTNASTTTHVDGSFDLSAPIAEAGSNLISCESCVSTDGTCDTEWKPSVLTGLPPNYTCTATAQTCTDGQSLTINLRATDAAQTLSQGTTVTRTCDTAAPVTSTDAPSAWVNADRTVTLTRSDAGSGISGGSSKTYYCQDTSDLCTPDVEGTSVSVTCAAGTVCQKYVRMFSRDAVGNQENTRSVLVRIDKQAPASASSSPSDGALVPAVYPMVSLSGTASDGSGSGVTKVEFSSNGGTSYATATGTTSWTASFTATQIDSLVRSRATDAAGNVETASAGITVWIHELTENNGMGHLDALGNMDYMRGVANDPDGTGLSDAAHGIAVDSTNHRLFVSDRANNRVLVFNLTTSDLLVDRMADFVLGQSTLYANDQGTGPATMAGPRGVAYDAGGNKLYVADTGNNRVLVFDVASVANGEAAANVLGQPDFTTGTANTQNAGNGCTTAVNACGLSSPKWVAFAANKLYVSDGSNARVLVFDVASISNGEAAVYVLGQGNFTSNGALCDSSHFYGGVQSVAADASENRLFVTDNHRTLVFDVSSIADGEPALKVLGKGDFVTCDCPAASNTNYACGAGGGAYLEGNGSGSPPDRFFHAGTQNRVLVFDVDAIGDGEPAVNVLGQAGFGATTAGTTQAVVNTPTGLAAAAGYLWLGDVGNNRVLQFNYGDGIVDGENASDLIGHFDPGGAVYTAGGANNPRETSYSSPSDVALDVANNRAFVSDSSNHRILVLSLNSTTKDLADRSADFVLGQPNFNATASGATASTLNSPHGLEYDPTNNRLYVADTNNNRVLVFNVAAITNGEAAVAVLGQPNLTTVTSGTTQTKMYYPADVVLSPSGSTLYVVEAGYGAGVGNSRVITFNVGDGTTDGEPAVNVLGQTDFNGNTTECSRSRFFDPRGAVLNGAGNKLFVAERWNNRVTVYDVSTLTDGEEADSVLGQGSFGTCSSGLTASQMNLPIGLAYDTTRNWLYVADRGNNRVTVFDVSSIANGQAAKTVLGQADLISGTAKTDSRGLTAPEGATFDAGRDRLWIVDTGNHRILNYDIP